MAISTPSTMTVLPETVSINPVCGVSKDSSDHRCPGCADINGHDVVLPQQVRHNLDLQFRFRGASPQYEDPSELERHHIRPLNRHISDLRSLGGGKRPQNSHRGTHRWQTRQALNGADQWNTLGGYLHGGVGNALRIHNLYLTLRVSHRQNRHPCGGYDENRRGV